jgi:hypothetical protein
LQASQLNRQQESRDPMRARKPLHVGNIPKWSAFDKPVAPLNFVRRPAGKIVLGAGEGI